MHEQKHSENLKHTIRQEIAAAGGAISFARFMELALYAPGLGYYTAGKFKLGARGDFVTAPEITPLFAQTVARQCQQIAKELPYYDIVEFGAGSGVFAKDLLLELKKPGTLPRYYYIVEVSAELRERQQLLLQSECPDLWERIQWLDTLEDVSIQGIIFANEVMDALPVHCFTMEEGVIQERSVVWRNDEFSWESREPSAELARQGEALCLPNGYQSEMHLYLSAWVPTVANMLKKGVILLFDYGYGRAEYYHPDRTMGTLMCYHQHQKNTNPFINIGLQDITAHVDFTTVIESADMAGCKLAGFTTQAGFLTACGLLEMVDNDLPPKEKFQQSQAIKKLLFPSEMGEAIKVMALTKQWDTPLLGFGLVDRRRDLA